MDSTYQSNFFIVPSYIRKLPGMTLAFLDVYETIFQFWNHGKPCFLSNQMIIKRTGHSATTIRDAIIYFEEKGEMLRKIIDGKRYIVQPEKKVEEKTESEIANDNNTENNKQINKEPNKLYTPPRAGARHNNNNINNKNINKSRASSFQNQDPPLADVTKQSTSYGYRGESPQESQRRFEENMRYLRSPG